jgi:probable biosynthetic protein (TIGR04098 family)
LSFYYYRIRGSRKFHLRTSTFGDRLHITTRLFDFGSESVLALHQIWRIPPGQPAPHHSGRVEPARFYAFGDENCLYVENFNRWVTRSDARSNQDLVRSSPLGFRHAHLPTLPPAYSPRLVCQQARARLSFIDPGTGDYRPPGPPCRVRYHVDPSRDLNGVGLLYFATYFSIVDWALLQLWRQLGRDDQSFLDRVVIDQQLCYLGNADAGSAIDASVQRREVAGEPGTEVVDVVLRGSRPDRLLAICTLRIQPGGTS